MAKQKASKQKKMNVRVDFTPMVDMMMLLITFFMLCTSLSKPQAMQLTMPSNDQNVQDQDRSATKASYTLTLYLGSNNKLYYVAGIPKYDDSNCMKETTWGSQGLRKVLMSHLTEDGTRPVAVIMQAKQKLDQKKLDNKINDDEYKKALSEIKKGIIDGQQQVQPMTIIIKPLDTSTYKNMVDALDEMQICSIDKYVIDKINPNDSKLLQLKGVK